MIPNLTLFSLSGLFVGIVSFILAFLIYRFGKVKLHRIWCYFNLAVGIWGIGAFYVGKETNPAIALMWLRFSFLGTIFIPVFLFHTVYLLCDGKQRFLLYFAYLQGLFFVFVSHSKYFVEGVRFVFSSFYYTKPGFLYHIFFAIWLMLVGYSYYLLVSTYLTSKDKVKKNQILYFFVGTIVGFFGGITNFLPVYNVNIYPFGNFTIPLYSLIVTYAIIRYRLLDISIAITRSGIFLAVYSLILGTPLLFIYFLQNELVSILGVAWWIVPFLCSTGLATLGPFLYIYFEKKAEDQLLKEQKNYQNILRGASSGMIRVRNLDLLLKLIVYVIAKIVRIKHAIIYLLNEDGSSYILKALRASRDVSAKAGVIDTGSPLIWQLNAEREPLVTEEIAMRLKVEPENEMLLSLSKQLNQLNAALVVPSFVEDRLIGILVLGEKRSGKIYSQDDLAVFSVLANQAALAIENAQFYEEIRKTQESLFQAEKMATIGTMADGLSHQINNRFHALSLIAGDSMDVIKTYDCSQCSEETKQIFNDLKNSLERIQANVLQGGEVVKGLLKYSRPGQGGFERVSFKDVLDGAVEMVSYKIKLREIDLVKDIPSSLPCLNANIVQLQEVFFNLIDNAYDAIKERQTILNEEDYRGRIEISAMADQGALHINVQDNGIGIKSDDKRKVFTPFFTTKATSKKGTGLGLYVIQKIIAAHNGQIRINSIYRSGTCFTVSLPVKPTLATA